MQHVERQNDKDRHERKNRNNVVAVEGGNRFTPRFVVVSSFLNIPYNRINIIVIVRNSVLVLIRFMDWMLNATK